MYPPRASIFIALLTLLHFVTSSTLAPPVLPLIVRNPYLSTWLGDARISPWNKWPMFWTGEEIGFGVLAAVPDGGDVYPLLGRPHDSLSGSRDGYNVSFPTYLGATYDASTTNLTYLIPAPSTSPSKKPLELSISFLSPITPTSTLRQSVPAAYISVHVSGDFNIDIYLDINGQWASGDRGADIEWDLTKTDLSHGNGLKTWSIKRQNEYLLSEIRDRAEWGTVHFSAPWDVRHECGVSGRLRPRFARTGKLQNKMDRRYRAIMDKEPVFAFAKSFELNATRAVNSPTAGSVLFTIAHTQDPVVQFASARGLTMMRPLWSSWFDDTPSLLAFHYVDFHNAARLASNYSEQLAIDADKSGSQEYVDIAALTARQVLGATSFSGTTENPILFLKEISSNGNFQTIDVIFPSFPFFLYTSPRWLTYLLEPILEHTLSGQYPNKYALHDLGTHFPNATGHPDGRDEYMPVEECGNILIMGLAIVNSLLYDSSLTAGSIWSSLGSQDFHESPGSVFPLPLEDQDGTPHLDDSWGGSTKGARQAKAWLTRSYPLWKQWTGYLVDFSLRPENQLSTDDFAGPLQLQTNLALKGILGIRAMSELARVIDNTADMQHYRNISEVYVTKWAEYGLSRDASHHATLSYDWHGSWTTLYNLYADALLCFHLDNTPLSIHSALSSSPQHPLLPPQSTKSGFVPHSIYTQQSNWYASVLQTYGLPLDSRHLYTKSDWSSFALSITAKSTRSAILTATARWVNETSTDRPMTDLYDTEGTGGFLGATFMARPVVGGTFAALTLERACGGRAMDGLSFLEDGEDDDEVEVVQEL